MAELVNELADLHVIALQKILGSDEDLILLTEVGAHGASINLWLLAKVTNRFTNRVAYMVTNSPPGSLDNCRLVEHSTLLDALSCYKEIRGAGSWSEWDRWSGLVRTGS